MIIVIEYWLLLPRHSNLMFTKQFIKTRNKQKFTRDNKFDGPGAFDTWQAPLNLTQNSDNNKHFEPVIVCCGFILTVR